MVGKRKAAIKDDAPRPKRKTRAKAVAAASDDTVDLSATPTRVAAFLRGVNVGGRTHSMKSIAEALGAAGFDNVVTFLASGNVILDVPSKCDAAQFSLVDTERHVEEVLEELFGSSIPVFVRSMADVARLDKKITRTATAVNVVLLKSEVTQEHRQTLKDLSTDADDFEVLDKEFVWYSATKMSESPLFKVSFEKKLGVPVTVRTVNTLRRIVKKFG